MHNTAYKMVHNMIAISNTDVFILNLYYEHVHCVGH